MTFTLTCMAAELSRALSLVAQVSGHQKQLPVLRAVRIEVGKNAAHFSATNMDHGATATIAAEGDGTILVDMATIQPKSTLLRQGQAVTISSDDDKTITITQGKTRWKAPILGDSGAFPVDLTKPLKGKPVSMTAGPLLAAFAIAPDAIWPGLAHSYDMGALLDMGDGKFRVISTNTKVFSVIEVDAPVLAVQTIVFPNDAMSAVRTLFKEADQIDVIASENAVSISVDGLTYRTKLVEMPFPDWRKAVERHTGGDNLDGGAVASSAALIETIDRAAAIAEDRSKEGPALAVRMTIGDGEFVAAATNRTGEEGNDSCECEGSAGTIVASAANMRKMLANIGSQNVRLRYSTSDQEKPIMVLADSGDRENYRLVMPMRA